MTNPNADNADTNNTGDTDAGTPDVQDPGKPKNNRFDPFVRSPASRPNSTASQRAGEQLEVELLPSRKEVARQAAGRRDADLGAVINLGLEEVADAGGPVPSPTCKRSRRTHRAASNWWSCLSYTSGSCHTNEKSAAGAASEKSSGARLRMRHRPWRSRPVLTARSRHVCAKSPGRRRPLRQLSSAEASSMLSVDKAR